MNFTLDHFLGTPGQKSPPSNKENRPLHSQILQRLQTTSQQKKRAISKIPSPTTPQTYIQEKSKALSPNLVSPPSSYSWRPFYSNNKLSVQKKELTLKDLKHSFESTSNVESTIARPGIIPAKNFDRTAKVIRRDKDFSITEFSGLEEETRNMDSIKDQSSIAMKSMQSGESISTRKTEMTPTVEAKLNDLDQKYQRLVKMITGAQRVQLTEIEKEYIGICDISIEGGASQPFERIEITKQRSRSKNLGLEMAKPQEQMKIKGKLSMQTTGSGNRVEVFSKQYQKVTQKGKSLEQKVDELLQLGERLGQKEKELVERENNIQASEKTFDELTKKLELQSEEILKQKLDFNAKVEEFNKNLMKLEKDKQEVLKKENAVAARVNQIKDFEKLEMMKKEFVIEKEKIEGLMNNCIREQDALKFQRIQVEKREEEVRRREQSVLEREQRIGSEEEIWQKERDEFNECVRKFEERMIRKEEELKDLERTLSLRKETYDELDLKMIGMRLNEEMWQKKRDLEIRSLQDRMNQVLEKEKELEKKEAHLIKMKEGTPRGSHRESHRKSHRKVGSMTWGDENKIGEVVENQVDGSGDGDGRAVINEC